MDVMRKDAMSAKSPTFHLVALFLSTTLTFSKSTENPSGPPIPLNSERIKSQFGSYGIEILKQTPKVRISNLYSHHDGERICRTLAVVHFAETIPQTLRREHDRIVKGESLGAVLKQAGWRITKSTIHIRLMALDGFQLLSERLMKAPRTRVLAVHHYDLSVNRSGQRIHYATITEIHHPDYLTTSKLQRIYKPSSAEEEVRPDESSSVTLEKVEQEITRLVSKHQKRDPRPSGQD